MKEDLHPVSRRFIEDFGRMTQSIGAGRVLGQLYAYLYFSPEPRGLRDMQDALGISKGSASMTVRQLQQWGAVRKVWVKGDRKDYYTAEEWVGGIIRKALVDMDQRQVLDVRIRSDPDRFEISAQHAAKPDGAMPADRDLPDDH